MPCCMLSCSNHVQLFAIPWTVAHQAPLSMGFSRQEYWSGLRCPPPGDLPDPGIEPTSPVLQADSLPSEPPGQGLNLLSSTGVGYPDFPLQGNVQWGRRASGVSAAVGASRVCPDFSTEAMPCPNFSRTMVEPGGSTRASHFCLRPAPLRASVVPEVLPDWLGLAPEMRCRQRPFLTNPAFLPLLFHTCKTCSA